MSSLDDVFAKINKDMKEEVCFKGSAQRLKFEMLPSNILAVDYATYGGLPMGRIHEFGGEQHSGKTLLSLAFVKSAQQKYPDRKAIFVDAESRFDAKWASKLGVDVDKLYVFNPMTQSAEQIFDAILAFIETGEVSIIILDSIGHLVSGKVIDESIEKGNFGGIAASLTRFSNIATGLLAKYNTCMICLNQVREDLGSMFPVYSTPGGKAFKHACSTRLELRRGSFIDSNGNDTSQSTENPAGNRVNFVVHKLSNASLDRKKGTFTLRYLEGIDTFGDLVEIAMKYDIITQSGAWYSCNINGEEIFKVAGKAKVLDILKSNEETYNLIFNKCKEAFEDNDESWNNQLSSEESEERS